jgi:hypothetical protein
LFALAFPGAASRATDLLGREPLKSIGLGFATLVCVPFFLVLLVITIIGIPLALLLIPLYLLLLFLGWVTTAMFLGRRGLAAVRGTQPVTKGWTLAALLAALVVLWLARRIPLIGSWSRFSRWPRGSVRSSGRRGTGATARAWRPDREWSGAHGSTTSGQLRGRRSAVRPPPRRSCSCSRC